MKTLLHQLTFILSISLFAFSCSSDPCETVVCVNGACNEGICDCAPGFKGPACDEIIYNFVGEYRSTVISRIGCPNAADNRTIATNSDNEFCATVDNKTTCLRVLFRVMEDKTYFLNVITKTQSGNIILSRPSVTEGTYTESGNTIIICDESNVCQTVTMNMEQNSFAWQQVVPESNACGFEWTLTRQ